MVYLNFSYEPPLKVHSTFQFKILWNWWECENGSNLEGEKMATKWRILTSLFTKQDSLIFISMLQLFSPIFTILKDRLHNSNQLGISPFDWTASLNFQTVGTGGHVPKWQKNRKSYIFCSGSTKMSVKRVRLTQSVLKCQKMRTTI